MKKGTPASRIPHGKTRGVKLDRTGVVSGELVNGEKIVNHVGGNKNIGETEGTMGTRIAHGGDWEAGTIPDHDGRRARWMGRTNGRKDRGVGSSVVRGTRVSDPVATNRG